MHALLVGNRSIQMLVAAESHSLLAAMTCMEWGSLGDMHVDESLRL